MDVELLQGHQSLPASAALEVAVLVKLVPSPQPAGASTGAVHVGFCLDRSGSMADHSGMHGLTKLEALKSAVQGTLQLLEGWGASVTMSAFSDSEQRLCRSLLLQGPGSSTALSEKVERLRTSGGTCAKAAMAPVLQVLMDAAHPVRRLVLVTDGQFNSDSVRPCRELAAQAREHGVAIWAFATGTSYDEAYLRELVDLSAPGGMFAHISDLGVLRARLEEELRAVASPSATAITLAVRPAPCCSILEACRLTPVQAAVAVDAHGQVQDRLDVLDARGQAYVIRVGATGLAAGMQPILSGTLRWQECGQRHERLMDVMLQVLAPGEAPSAAHPQVVSTVLATKAAQATLLGKAELATRLYAAAGQTDLAQQLMQLGTALPSGTDAARSLRSQAVGSTRLVALGSGNLAVPGGSKGGQP